MLSQKIHNVVVIGSGPAGWSACIYAGRDLLEPVMITGDTIGGQLMLTTEIENYPGFADPIKASDLMEAMRKQSERCGTTVIESWVTKVDFSSHPFTLELNNNTIIKAKSVIISTGAAAKWLGLPSEERFKGFGVSGCAVCDGFFFREKIVGVVGGGNTAMEEADYLTKYAKKVYLIVRRDELSGEKLTMRDVLNNPKIEILWNQQVIEVQGVEEETGHKYVNGVIIQNTTNKSTSNLSLDGLFVAIGHAPNTSLFNGQLKLHYGYITTEPNSTKTSIEGVFAAGDVQDPIYKQAVTSAGTGCMAALEVSAYLSKLSK